MEQTDLLTQHTAPSLSRNQSSNAELPLNLSLNWRQRLQQGGIRIVKRIDDALNSGLPQDSSIHLRIGWPLLLLPISLVNQLLAPHPVWIVLVVVIIGLYSFGFAWVRLQKDALDLQRERRGNVVVAGDELEEHFRLVNDGTLAVLWAEVADQSDLPGYYASRVVACSGNGNYHWQSSIACHQRGIYRLGPTVLRWGDPFGLFRADRYFDYTDQVVIYPRVAQLPQSRLHHGNVGGARQRQHLLLGALRSASVRPYQPGDSLRHVHWPTTARYRDLMVTELDSDYGGEVWIVLDLNEHAHQGEGNEGTLEYSIVVAASLAAQLLNSNERLSVGLLFAAPPNNALGSALGSAPDDNSTGGLSFGAASEVGSGFQLLAPQSGQAQFWDLMGALAMARPAPISLRQLLHSSRTMVGRRQSVIVITPQITASIPHPEPSGDAGHNEQAQEGPQEDSFQDEWIGEILQGQSRQRGSVILIQHSPQNSSDVDIEAAESETSADDSVDDSVGDSVGDTVDSESLAEQRRALLQQNDFHCTIYRTNEFLPSVVTQQRKRTIIRTTPLGGAIRVEVEEDVA